MKNNLFIYHLLLDFIWLIFSIVFSFVTLFFYKTICDYYPEKSYVSLEEEANYIVENKIQTKTYNYEILYKSDSLGDLTFKLSDGTCSIKVFVENYNSDSPSIHEIKRNITIFTIEKLYILLISCFWIFSILVFVVIFKKDYTVINIRSLK